MADVGQSSEGSSSEDESSGFDESKISAIQPIREIREEDEPQGPVPVIFPSGPSNAPHRDWVRLILAGFLVAALVFVVGLGAVAWYQGREVSVSELSVLISPISALAGAAVAFYFSETSK